jgi:hypothetical protein
LHPKGAKTNGEAWHSAVGNVFAQLRHHYITGPGLKWDCADGVDRQCNHLLASWAEDHPDADMVAQISYGSCPMCKIPKGAPMGHLSFLPLLISQDQHIYSELLADNNIDSLHTLGVHLICNQFWQYPLCNVYRLWQTDTLYQLLSGLVQDLLHRLHNTGMLGMATIDLTIDSHP